MLWTQQRMVIPNILLIFQMYVSSLLTSGDAPSIRLAADVLSTSADMRPIQNGHYRVDYVKSVELVSNAAKEYFNSASSLTDPALELARFVVIHFVFKIFF